VYFLRILHVNGSVSSCLGGEDAKDWNCPNERFAVWVEWKSADEPNDSERGGLSEGMVPEPESFALRATKDIILI
jgi:hypothetical protein